MEKVEGEGRWRRERNKGEKARKLRKGCRNIEKRPGILRKGGRRDREKVEGDGRGRR